MEARTAVWEAWRMLELAPAGSLTLRMFPFLEVHGMLRHEHRQRVFSCLKVPYPWWATVDHHAACCLRCARIKTA